MEADTQRKGLGRLNIRMETDGETSRLDTLGPHTAGHF